MRSLSVLLGTAGFLAVLLPTHALAAPPCNEKFILINESHNGITGFFASPIGSDNWGDNMMPQGKLLSPVHQIPVDPYDGTNAIRYDFRVDFDDGNSVYKRDVSVCNIETYTIHP